MQATAVERLGILTKAMAAPESFAIRMVFGDGKGNRTRRVASPTQLDQGTGKFVALCLCHQEPRSFKLDNRTASLRLAAPQCDALNRQACCLNDARTGGPHSS